MDGNCCLVLFADREFGVAASGLSGVAADALLEPQASEAACAVPKLSTASFGPLDPGRYQPL